MGKLKECPYCRGTAILKETSVDFADNIIHRYFVECAQCGASTVKYDTYFACCFDGKTFYHMIEEEAINKAICNWNNERFDIQTQLSHMTDREKIQWHTEHLLKVAWYGAMVPMESLKWKTAWRLREIAETKRLLSISSRKKYDLGEVAKILVNDALVVELVASYLKVSG